MRLRYVVVVVIAAVCGVAAATVLAQQPGPVTLSGTVRVAGSGASGVKLSGQVKVNVPEGVPRPVITGFEVWTGPGITLNGRRLPACTLKTLGHGGPSKCPAGSIMGTGYLLGNPSLDFNEPGRLLFINTPSGVPALWTVLQSPARVQAAARGVVVRDATARWPQHLRWTIPQSLQIVAGIPITPFGASFTLGGKAYAKDYISATRCPTGGWAWKLRVYTGDGAGGAAGVLDAHGRIPCLR